MNPDTPKPVPGKSQALVKVKAFGLNRMDLIQREGRYPVPPQAPKTLGVEFSGTIECFGESAERGFKEGDEVFGLAYGGAYAEYIAVSTHMLIHKPKELSWEQAAGIPETWITATQALYLVGQFKEGEKVLWHACGSSVSIAGIQLSKADGASAIYGTARGDDKVEFAVKELGATAAFNLKTQDWAQEVLNATDGKGVDVIVDFIGKDTFGDNLRAAARDARVVQLGTMSGSILPAGVDIGLLLYKRISYNGSTLRSRDEAYQQRLRDSLEEHALPKFKDGTFKVVIEKTFDWKDITKAHQLMESNQTKGKLICTIS